MSGDGCHGASLAAEFEEGLADGVDLLSIVGMGRLDTRRAIEGVKVLLRRGLLKVGRRVLDWWCDW